MAFRYCGWREGKVKRVNDASLVEFVFTLTNENGASLPAISNIGGEPHPPND
jgi:hypothetical protein